MFTLCILRPSSFVKTAVHWSQLNPFSDLAVTEAKVGVITGTVVGTERGGMGRWEWISRRGRCSSFQGFLLTSSRLRFSYSSGGLESGGTLTALLLVSWATVALPANRGGRRRERRAWVAKAHIEGHQCTMRFQKKRAKNDQL